MRTRIEEILADDVLMAEIKAVYSIFKDYVNVKPDQTKPCLLYTSKQLKDLGDKLPADKKAPIETALNKLKEAHKAQDIAGIDAAMADRGCGGQESSPHVLSACVRCE